MAFNAAETEKVNALLQKEKETRYALADTQMETDSLGSPLRSFLFSLFPFPNFYYVRFLIDFRRVLKGLVNTTDGKRA
jgi:hypothetical protein